MGQKRTLQIPLAKGLDERISKKILPDGTLSVLHNSRIDKLGKVVRRHGWGTFPDDGIAETDPYAVSKTVCPLGITEADGSLNLLTTRRMYRLAPGEVSWTGMGPADGRPAATTPVETLDVPIATWAVGGNVAGTTRKGTAESHCAAIVCDVTGNVAGSYVLLASRSIAYDESADGYKRGMGYVQLTGYRTWVDDFGIRHWEQLFTKSFTTYPSMQLRVWAVGDSLVAGWYSVEDEGDTYCLYLARWAARSTPFTAPSATRIAVAESASEYIDWDVAVPTTAYEAGGQDCFFISALLGTATCKAWLLQEDLTVYLSVTLASPGGGFVANKLCCCWAQPTGYNLLYVFWTQSSSGTMSRGGWELSPGIEVDLYTTSGPDPAVGGLPVIDGVQTVAGDRVLLNNGADNKQGVWRAASGAWTRPSDYATGKYFSRILVHVTAGTTYADTWWHAPTDPGVIGTDLPDFSVQSEALKVVKTISDWPTTTELTHQMVAHHSLVDSGSVVVWTIDANSTTAPEIRYWHAVAHKFHQVLGTFTSSTISLAPGMLASKVFAWDARDVAWWLTVPPEPTTIEVSAVEALANKSLVEAPSSIDGVTLTNGMLVLLTQQTDTTENGVYQYVESTNDLTRPTSFPTGGNAKEILIKVTGGAVYPHTLWYQTLSPAIIDTNILSFVRDGTNGGLQDYSDRHYVLALTEPDFGNFTPLAIVSPHQAAEFSDAFGGSDSTALGTAWPCDHALWEPTDWFWANIEAIRGNTEQYPEMAPRIHAWHQTPVMRAPLEVKDRMVFAAQGLSHCYGDSGPEELAIINGPGPIAVRAVTASTSTLFPAGTYSYRAVYRLVRHDGSTLRSIPSPSVTLTVGAGMGTVWIAIRTPRLTVLTDEAGSLLSIYADIYRTEEGPGANWHHLGSAVIGTDNTAANLLFYDDFSVRNTDIVTRELLYTLGTSDIPAVTTPSFKVIVLHGGRIFGAHGRRLHYSTQQASLSAPYFPAGGYLEFEDTITALASVEAGLVVFARTKTWLLQGTGPGPDLQPFWPVPQLLARDVGCVSQASILSWRDGLFFQSDRGIEALRKNGAIETISEPVRDQLANYPIVRKVVDADDENQIRWLCSSAGCYPSATTSIWLCWDSTFDQWSTESARGTLDCSTLASTTAGVQSLMAMTRESAGGVNLYNRAGWYDDDASPEDFPSRTLTTGWIRPGGIGGWGRLRRLRLHGDTPAYDASVEGETVTVTVKQHSEADVEVSSTHTLVVSSPSVGATAEQVLIELAPTNQQCSEFAVTIVQSLPQDLDHPAITATTSASTNITLSGGQTIDGATVVPGAGHRVLCLGQTDPKQNGLWLVNSGAWTRPTDFAVGALANVNVVFVDYGSVRGNTYWLDTEADIIGTDNLSFTQQYFRGGEGTSWNAISFDWEDVPHRPRTTTTLRA